MTTETTEWKKTTNRFVAFFDILGFKELVMLSVLLFFCSFGNAQTNVYHPFPDSNATWCYGFFGVPIEYGGCGDSQLFCWADPPFYVGYDTIINSYHYKILYDSTGHLGYMRQDSLLKKVYVIPAFNNGMGLNDSTEYIAYNGTLQIGDTINNTYLNNPHGDTIIVSSIDSGLLADNTYRKGISTNLHGGNTGSWIEGIGMTTGFFNQMSVFFEYGRELLCFRNNNYCELHNPSWGPNSYYACHFCGDSLLTNINRYNYTNYKMEVFPNPIQNNNYLEIKYHLPDVNYIEIINILGEQKLILKDGKTPVKIFISDFAPGMYFIKISADKAKDMFTQKFIVK